MKNLNCSMAGRFLEYLFSTCFPGGTQSQGFRFFCRGWFCGVLSFAAAAKVFFYVERRRAGFKERSMLLNAKPDQCDDAPDRAAPANCITSAAPEVGGDGGGQPGHPLDMLTKSGQFQDSSLGLNLISGWDWMRRRMWSTAATIYPPSQLATAREPEAAEVPIPPPQATFSHHQVPSQQGSLAVTEKRRATSHRRVPSFRAEDVLDSEEMFELERAIDELDKERRERGFALHHRRPRRGDDDCASLARGGASSQSGTYRGRTSPSPAPRMSILSSAVAAAESSANFASLAKRRNRLTQNQRKIRRWIRDVEHGI